MRHRQTPVPHGNGCDLPHYSLVPLPAYAPAAMSLHISPDDFFLDPDPFTQFGIWFDEAAASKLPLYEAMNVATVREDGRPTSRVILLKDFDHNGFVFYTNYKSRKADELAARPHAALTFWWATLEKQIRIEGTIDRVSARESDEYFKTRPRGSQIGAHASPQSAVIRSRAELESRVDELLKEYGDDKEVPRPEHWGGYRVIPDRFEFWIGRLDRLHDRFEYVRSGESWQISRLAP